VLPARLAARLSTSSTSPGVRSPSAHTGGGVYVASANRSHSAGYVPSSGFCTLSTAYSSTHLPHLSARQRSWGSPYRGLSCAAAETPRRCPLPSCRCPSVPCPPLPGCSRVRRAASRAFTPRRNPLRSTGCYTRVAPDPLLGFASSRYSRPSVMRTPSRPLRPSPSRAARSRSFFTLAFDVSLTWDLAVSLSRGRRPARGF